MNAAADPPVLGGQADTPTLLDLLWEPDDCSAKDQSGDAAVVDAACRAAALSLQQLLSMHVAQDSSVEWSDTRLELPAARAPAPANGTPSLERVPARSGRSSSTLHQDGAGRYKSGPATTSVPYPTQAAVTQRDQYGNTGELGSGPVQGASREHERPTDIAWKILVRTTQLLASPDRQRWLSDRLPGASIQRELICLWFNTYRPVDCETMLQSHASATFRGISASMRKLMMRRELFSLPIDSLLVDKQWSELAAMAGRALEVLDKESGHSASRSAIRNSNR